MTVRKGRPCRVKQRQGQAMVLPPVPLSLQHMMRTAGFSITAILERKSHSDPSFSLLK